MSTPVLQGGGSKPLDVAWVREQFPSLQLQVNSHAAAFLDGPAGTQVPKQVMDAVQNYYLKSNANTCGAFATSRSNDAIIASARAAMADFFNCDTDEVVFGQNMTTITFALARAIGRVLEPGDEIVVTTLDHDANVAPWRALEEMGMVIRQVDIHESDCTLNLEDLKHKINANTKLVAVGYASNAVGTINSVAEITKLAHAAGAMAFIDAVHYAPHGPIDVRALDCDFLACSSYKFFGPHMGILYARREHLMRLQPYKVAANTHAVPFNWEMGTLNHECIAGITACVDYLADLGRRIDPALSGRRPALLGAWKAIQNHERALIERLISGLLQIPGLTFYGISDPKRFDDRCPTVAVRIAGHPPLKLATELGQRGFFTWDGNYYALNLTEQLGVEKDGGFLRIGLAHYNTSEEVDRLLTALRGITK